MNTISGGGQYTLTLICRVASGFVLPSLLAPGQNRVCPSTPLFLNGFASARATPQTSAASGMCLYPREPCSALPGGDPGCCACASSQAMRTGEDRRFPVGLARSPAPVRTGSGGDLIATRLRRLPWESIAAHYLYRRAIPRVPGLCFVL